MDASGFTTLAGHFPEGTVVTYDPRGVGRSARADDVTGATPDEHAEDLERRISELDAGPVDIFAGSGGAVNALALVSRHPERSARSSRTSRPSRQYSSIGRRHWRCARTSTRTSERDGREPVMAKFIEFTNLRGPIPPDFTNHAPNSGAVGLPIEDDGSRDHPLLGPHMVWVTRYEPDFDCLRGASARIVVAGGAESEGSSRTGVRWPWPSDLGSSR